jgi:hypothetical protein
VNKIKKLEADLFEHWKKNLQKYEVRFPTGKILLKLICLFEKFPEKVNQDEISEWFKKNTNSKYDLQARHIARTHGWDVRSGNSRFTVGIRDKNLSHNDLRLHSFEKPNPIWLKEKQNKKRLKTLKDVDWNEILNIFSERGCAVCGRFFKNYDQGHILRSKSHEKGNIVPMCSPCNNWGQEFDFKVYDGLVYRPIIKK